VSAKPAGGEEGIPKDSGEWEEQLRRYFAGLGGHGMGAIRGPERGGRGKQ